MINILEEDTYHLHKTIIDNCSSLYVFVYLYPHLRKVQNHQATLVLYKELTRATQQLLLAGPWGLQL